MGSVWPVTCLNSLIRVWPSPSTRSARADAAAADATAGKQRRIQRAQDATDRKSPPAGAGKKKPGVQAGARRQPDKLPAQHMAKPGSEADMQLAPRFMAPHYKGSGKLDVFVNNAALQMHAESIEDITEERFEETFRTNIFGYFHRATAARPFMKAGGSIANSGSVTGLEGAPKLLDYSSTKGAIHASTKSLAKNLIDKGIWVNAVALGPVWTPLNPADAPAAEVAEFGAGTQMKRAAQPEELSPAYVFLASPVCAGYTTGIVLPVTGSVGAI